MLNILIRQSLSSDRILACKYITRRERGPLLGVHPIGARAVSFSPSCIPLLSHTKSMALFAQIAHLLSQAPDLFDRIEYVQVSRFFALVERLSPLITTVAPRRAVGHPPLPVKISETLSRLIELPLEDISVLWELLEIGRAHV